MPAQPRRAGPGTEIPPAASRSSTSAIVHSPSRGFTNGPALTGSGTGAGSGFRSSSGSGSGSGWGSRLAFGSARRHRWRRDDLVGMPAPTQHQQQLREQRARKCAESEIADRPRRHAIFLCARGFPHGRDGRRPEAVVEAHRRELGQLLRGATGLVTARRLDRDPDERALALSVHRDALEQLVRRLLEPQVGDRGLGDGAAVKRSAGGRPRPAQRRVAARGLPLPDEPDRRVGPGRSDCCRKSGRRPRRRPANGPDESGKPAVASALANYVPSAPGRGSRRGSCRGP